MAAPASIAVLGDSVVADVDSLYGEHSVPLELCRLLDISPVGVKGYGFFGLWRDEWSLTTGGDAWTRATTSDAWDRGPLLGTTTGCGTFTGAGSGKVATWTKPSHVTVTSFTLHVVDGASSANFAYRIDGGAWTNVSNTWGQDNSYDRITINSAVTSTVEVRCANAAGTSVQTYLVGLEPHDSGGSGPVVHALGASSEFSFTVVRTTSGDWDAWLQAVQPAYVILECPFSNDIAFWPSSSVEANMQAIIDAVDGYGGETMLFCSGEQDGRNTTHQAEMRTMAHDLASTNGLYIVDVYDLWGNYAAANAAGYMFDSLHPSTAGTRYMAQRLANPILARGGQWGRFRAA